MANAGMERDSVLAAFWQALSHPIRLQVLRTLLQEGPQNVGDLVKEIGIGQGHLSNHLACLKSCGLVQAEQRGRFVYYRVADARVPRLLELGGEIMADHLQGVALCAAVQQESGGADRPQFSLG